MPTRTPTRHRLAKHGYNLTSDTRYFLARPREEIACVGRKIVAVFGESVSVSVSVSASWNASFIQLCVKIPTTSALARTGAALDVDLRVTDWSMVADRRARNYLLQPYNILLHRAVVGRTLYLRFTQSSWNYTGAVST